MILPPLLVAITWTWPTSRVRSLSPSHRRGVWMGSWTGVGSRNRTETRTSKSTGQPSIHRYYTLQKPIGPDYKMVRNVNHERNKTYYHKLGTICCQKNFAGEMYYKIKWNIFKCKTFTYIFRSQPWSTQSLNTTNILNTDCFHTKIFHFNTPPGFSLGPFSVAQRHATFEHV